MGTMRVISRGMVAGLGLAFALAGTCFAAPKVMKYGHFQPAKLDQPKHAAALAFKNYVEANTIRIREGGGIPGKPTWKRGDGHRRAKDGHHRDGSAS